MARKALMTTWKWLTSGREEAGPRAWRHCPICDRELAGPYPSGLNVAGPAGPTVLEPAQDELIAKCPVHGHAPYNSP